jgi:hypothetical protein
MPQFDRLEASFKEDPNVQAVLGMIYADILEFHQRVRIRGARPRHFPSYSGASQGQFLLRHLLSRGMSRQQQLQVPPEEAIANSLLTDRLISSFVEDVSSV